MAYLQSRSNIAISGVTYCGWTPPSQTITIGGTVRTSSVLINDWTLTNRSDGTPPTLRFRTKTITPVVGQDVKMTYATPDDYLFAGTILERTIDPFSAASGLVQWDCLAAGYQWLLDRYDRILASYASVGVETIVGDILYRFTNGGFTVGYVPASLGNLTIQFTYETVYAALQRIARAVGAQLEITAEKAINIFVTYPETALPTMTEVDAVIGSLQYREDLSQVRTRVLYEGLGSAVTTAASAGAATLDVDDVSPFGSSGTARQGFSLITYSGVTRTTGTAGTLTGCSGILYDVPAGETIDVIVTATDSAATTALATVLGGGLSGQATNYLQDGRLSVSELTARSSADLATFGGALDELAFVYKTPKRYVRAGRSLVVSMTNPFALSGTFTIQNVILSKRGAFRSTVFEFEQRLELAGFTRAITDLLGQLRG